MLLSISASSSPEQQDSHYIYQSINKMETSNTRDLGEAGSTGWYLLEGGSSRPTLSFIFIISLLHSLSS